MLPHAQHALSHTLMHDNNKERLDLALKCARTLFSDGRYKEAEKLDVQVMQTRKRVLGDEHLSTLTSMHNFALTLQSQACHEEAFALMERCSQLRKQVLGEEHPDTQSSLDMLSNWRAERRDESP